MRLDIDIFYFGLLSPFGLKDLWIVKGLKTCVCNYYPELKVYLNENSSQGQELLK